MQSIAPDEQDPQARPEETGLDSTRLEEIAAWVVQLSRTLKTCRLYDSSNPTVLRFREDLVVSLVWLLGRHGPFEVEITGTDLLLSGTPLFPANARDEGLAFAFYRDGVRAVRFLPGITPDEVEALLEALLRRGRAGDVEEDDLVTLLWQSHHPHLEIECVSLDGEVDPVEEGASAQEPIPWPLQTSSQPDDAESAAGPGAMPDVLAPEPEGFNRSDDWPIGDEIEVIEEGLIDLEARLGEDVERFRGEFVSERRDALHKRLIDIVEACLSAGATAGDRKELDRLLPRAARAALSDGDWGAARAAVELIRGSSEADSLFEDLATQLASSEIARETARRIDHPSGEIPPDLLGTLRVMGAPAIRWAADVLGELRRARVRERWIAAVKDSVREAPERLRPSLGADGEAWTKSAVELLGAAGGPAVVPMLELAADASDPVVRQSVVEALGGIETAPARRLLARFLDAPESRLFCAALQRLSQAPDLELVVRLQTRIQSAEFDSRPAGERRLVFSVLASCATEETVEFLDGELHRGGWLSRPNENRLQSVARCLARIGTERARAVLQKGAGSRKPAVRRACSGAMGGGDAHA